MTSGPERDRPRPIGTLPLASLLIRFRVRSWRNGLGAGRRAGQAAFAAALAFVISFAYVGLFTQAFAGLAAAVPPAGQVAALAVVTGTIALASLTARAASNEAVRAGSGENELLLSRPVTLSRLVAARGFADAITDPVAGLFLLPVLIAALIVWGAGAAAVAVAIVTSMTAQLAVSMLAYTVQIAVVRFVPPLRRRAIWTGLRLIAALALAALWMVGSWVMRAPVELGRSILQLAGSPLLLPGRVLVAPLAAARAGDLLGVGLALVALAAVAAAALALAVLVARAAGMKGWEEAGAAWAEAAQVPAAGGRRITAATKDLRLIRRDRPQLLALIAMPVIFVGVQVFGAAGFDPKAASLESVACLAYSLALYLATIGPLAHMQAERRAFWVLRTVPVPLGRLFAAKARAWSVVVATAAALAFVPLAAAVPGASPLEIAGMGLLVLTGTTGMTFLAIGMAASGADLSDEGRAAVGPSVIYGFLLVGGLYNFVLVGDAPTRVLGLAFYAFVTAAFFTTGVEHAASCMDPEAVAERRVRIADGATLALILALVGRGITAGVGEGGRAAIPRDIGAALQAATLLLVGGAAALYLRRRPAGQRSVAPLPAAVLGLGAGAIVAMLVAVAGISPAGHELRSLALLPIPALGLAALLVLCEELVFRGVVQRALVEAFERRVTGWGQARAKILAAAGAFLVSLVAIQLSGRPGGTASVAAAHLAASIAYAATERSSSAWLARLVILVAPASESLFL